MKEIKEIRRIINRINKTPMYDFTIKEIGDLRDEVMELISITYSIERYIKQDLINQKNKK